MIGAADSLTGSPIVEGDILTLPTGAGLPPSIFVSAESLALIAPRGVPAQGDDLDALDLPEPGTALGLLCGGGLIHWLARRRRARG